MARALLQRLLGVASPLPSWSVAEKGLSQGQVGPAWDSEAASRTAHAAPFLA